MQGAGQIMGFTFPNGKRIEAPLALWIMGMIKVLAPTKLNEIGAAIDQMQATAQRVPIINGHPPKIDISL